MSYLIRLVRTGKTYFAYRRANKDEWSTTMYPSQGTPFRTEKGAWRSIQQGDNLLASVTGSACWYDLFVKRGYTVSVVNSDTYHDPSVDESLREKPI
jgi:hypothetical protein